MRNIVSRATRITWPAELCKSGGDEDKLSLIHISEPTRPY